MRRTCMHTCGVWYRGAGRSTPFSGQQPSLSGKDGCTESVHAMDCLSNMPQHDRMVSVEAFNRSNAFQGWTPLPPPLQPQSPKKRGSWDSLWDYERTTRSFLRSALVQSRYPSSLHSLYIHSYTFIIHSFELFEAILWHGKQLGLFSTGIPLTIGVR